LEELVAIKSELGLRKKELQDEYRRRLIVRDGKGVEDLQEDILLVDEAELRRAEAERETQKQHDSIREQNLKAEAEIKSGERGTKQMKVNAETTLGDIESDMIRAKNRIKQESDKYNTTMKNMSKIKTNLQKLKTERRKVEKELDQWIFEYRETITRAVKQQLNLMVEAQQALINFWLQNELPHSVAQALTLQIAHEHLSWQGEEAQEIALLECVINPPPEQGDLDMDGNLKVVDVSKADRSHIVQEYFKRFPKRERRGNSAAGHADDKEASEESSEEESDSDDEANKKKPPLPKGYISHGYSLPMEPFNLPPKAASRAPFAPPRIPRKPEDLFETTSRRPDFRGAPPRINVKRELPVPLDIGPLRNELRFSVYSPRESPFALTARSFNTERLGATASHLPGFWTERRAAGGEPSNHAKLNTQVASLRGELREQEYTRLNRVDKSASPTQAMRKHHRLMSPEMVDDTVERLSSIESAFKPTKNDTIRLEIAEGAKSLHRRVIVADRSEAFSLHRRGRVPVRKGENPVANLIGTKNQNRDNSMHWRQNNIQDRNLLYI